MSEMYELARELGGVQNDVGVWTWTRALSPDEVRRLYEAFGGNRIDLELKEEPTSSSENLDCSKHCPGCACTKLVVGHEGFTLCSTCRFCLSTKQFEAQQKLWTLAIRFFKRETDKSFGQQHHVDTVEELQDQEDVRNYLNACRSHLAEGCLGIEGRRQHPNAKF